LNLPLYIAKRYLVSKKSHHIINIISIISIVGVAIGTMALIIVLSVFNGFDNLVVSLFSSFNAPLRIEPRFGKTFNISDFPLEKIREIPGVKQCAEVVEAEALMRYRDNQSIVTLKGVPPDYAGITGIDTMIVEGSFTMEEQDRNFTVPGYGIAANLSLDLNDFMNPVTVFMPRRDANMTGGLEQAFNYETISPSGVFQIQYDYDVRYAFVPLRFLLELTGYEQERSAIEISVKPGALPDEVQKSVAAAAGDRFTVKNRFQQQEILYQIMTSEKRYIFMILTLILIIATFNVIGTLSMLILDKKRDIAVLKSLGADQSLIRRIFLFEGMLVSFIGAVVGLFFGAVICWLQMRFGFVRLGGEDSSFVVSAYPVWMKFSDFLLVFLTVMIIGFLASLYPVYNIRRIDTTMTRGE
jgi:lipoprotein-releasing system permease protein